MDNEQKKKEKVHTLSKAKLHLKTTKILKEVENFQFHVDLPSTDSKRNERDAIETVDTTKCES